MKKSYKIAVAYLVFGLIAGVFAREVTKFTNFTGQTVMWLVHTHALVLGTAVFVLLPLFMKNFHIEEQKSFKKFEWTYNIGLILTLGFMTVRGVTQLFALPISSTVSSMILGFAGLGHIILTTGIVFLFQALFKSAENNEI